MKRRNVLASAAAAAGGYVLGLIGVGREEMRAIAPGDEKPTGTPAFDGTTDGPASPYVRSIRPGESIQDAYASLPAESGGVIYLLPGRHDVGDGLTLDRTKPVSLVGLARWRRHVSTEDLDEPEHVPGAVLHSSTSAPWLIDTTQPMDSVVNGFGFEFRNLVLDFRTSEIGILADNVNHGVVENCFFAGPGGDAWAIMLVTKDSFVQPGTSHGDDASWWRVMNNNARDCGLFAALGAFGGNTPAYQWNHNNHLIEGNVCFQASATTPAIWLRGGHRSHLVANNLEGDWDPAILLESCWQSRSDGNAGESSLEGITFVRLEGSSACLISDLGASTSSGQTLIQMDAGSGDNIVLAPALTAERSLYGPDGYVDEGVNNLIVSPAATRSAGASTP